MIAAGTCATYGVDYCLAVPTASIHRVQETHVALYHIMWDMVHTFLQHKGIIG